MTAKQTLRFDPAAAAMDPDRPGIPYRIDQASVRASLPERQQPYWMVIERGIAVGLRKGTSHTWYGRCLVGKNQVKMTSFGPAPESAGDRYGRATLTFEQAIEATYQWASTLELAEDPNSLEPMMPAELPIHGDYSVAHAAMDYVKTLGGNRLRRGRTVARLHVIPSIGSISVRNLERRDVEAWLNDVAASRRNLRPGYKERNPDYWSRPASAEAGRKRRAYANNCLRFLKNALDYAYYNGRALTDQPWNSVRPLKQMTAPPRWALDAGRHSGPPRRKRCSTRRLDHGRPLHRVSDIRTDPAAGSGLFSDSRKGPSH